MATRRKIVRIDEEKCDGCGLCIPACPEGAIQVVGGKARLVSETYCDGLGACLGHCPRGAITLEEREAAEFDPEAVEHHVASRSDERAEPTQPRSERMAPLPRGCPGNISRLLRPGASASSVQQGPAGGPSGSNLGNWPIQIELVAPKAHYFRGAKLLIAADCVPFALADFHRRLLCGRVLLIGCPKLDDAASYCRKLTDIFRQNDIRAVEVAYMEVPCCYGLVRLVQLAMENSGKEIPVELIKTGLDGAVIETVAAGRGTGSRAEVGLPCR